MTSVTTGSTSCRTRGVLGQEYYQFSLMSDPLCRRSQRRPLHCGHYKSSTLMMDMQPVKGPQHGENYQPPTQMMGETPLRGTQYGDDDLPPTQMMGQKPMRGPIHGENYQPLTQMMQQTPLTTIWREFQTPCTNNGQKAGPPHEENYRPPTQMMGETPLRGTQYDDDNLPPTQMMGQTPVRGPIHGENYQPPTQMMSLTPLRGTQVGEDHQLPTQISVRELPYRENDQPPAPMMGQKAVSGPPHGENRTPTQVMGETPLRGTQSGDDYQPPTLISGLTDSDHIPLHSSAGKPPDRAAWAPPSMYYPHQMPIYPSAYLNTPHPYANFPHTLAPIRPTTPLQEGVVGGHWNSQSYMSNGQPQTNHPQSKRSSNIESCPPPPGTSYLLYKLYSELLSMNSSSGRQYTKRIHFMGTIVDYVKSTYRQCRIVKNLNVLKWPPTPSKVFINLACIDWESVSKMEADEYTRAMVEDDNVDVIMKKKTNIEFDDIVRDLPPLTASEKVVLVEGAPGVGKSTFAWEFCRRWERGEIGQQYQLVLLLQLRDERMSKAKSLRELIYHSSESVCEAVVEELESTSGVDTLLILEGFDELSDYQRKEPSIFLQLILGKLLLHATIMITSRPWATGALLAHFKHRIFLHVEILSFTEKNITKYVTSVFTGEGKKTSIDLSVGDPDKVSEEAKKNIDDVMAYIGKYPQIKACMYIPLNAAIVVSIYRESMKSNWVLPTTLTELYESLTRILLLRYLCGHTEYQKCSVSPLKTYQEMCTVKCLSSAR